MTHSTLNRPQPTAAPTKSPSTSIRRTAAKSPVVVRARLVSYPQTRKHAKAHKFETAVFRVLMFLFLAMTAYGVSSVAGQVAVEKSHREELNAQERAKSVKVAEATLRSEIIELSRPDHIDNWAQANLFEKSGVMPITPDIRPHSTLVALRD